MSMKVGFIGAGNRMREYYLPVIERMSAVDAVGFWTRSQETREATTSQTDVPCMSIDELNNAADVIVVCVPAAAMSKLSMAAIKDTTKPLVLETPVVDEHVARRAWELRDQRVIVAAENWPFRPMNVVMKMVIEAGYIGDVHAVVNDFRGYEYHGFAMMRTLAGQSRPRSAFGSSWSAGQVKLIDGRGQQKTLVENWDTGVVELWNNVRLVHNFNSVHSRCQARGPRSLRVMGTKGFIGADDTTGAQMTMVGDDFVPFDVPLNIERNESGNFSRIWFSIDEDDHDISGRLGGPDGVNASVLNRFDFDDQQFSTYLMLEELYRRIVLDEKNAWTYPAWESWLDVLCVNAIRHSSQVGQRVTFPTIPWMV